MRWKYLVPVLLLSAPGQLVAQPAQDEPKPGSLPDTITPGQQTGATSPGAVEGSRLAATDPNPTGLATEALFPSGPRELPAPQYPSAPDPVTSGPTPGALPELAAPLLDIVAGTLEVSEKGTVVTGVFAPFRFSKPQPLLSETRVKVKGGSSALQPWGFTISTGYSSATEKLQLSKNDRLGIQNACRAASSGEPPELLQATESLAKRYNALDPEERGNRVLEREQGESLAHYYPRVYTQWNGLLPGAKAKLKPEADKLAEESYKSHDRFGDCWIEKAVQARVRQAYRQGRAAYLFGGADFFPFVSGPSVAPMAGEPLQEPTPHALAGWNVGTNLGYFVSPRSRVWLTINYSAKRAKTTADDLDSRMGVGIDIAYNKGVGKIEADGFQPGVALGAFGAVQHCLDDDGCDEAIAGYSNVLEDPLQASRVYSAGAYVDIRASSKIQLRFGIPFTIYDLASAPPNSDGGKLAWGIAPTVSLTVASWMFTPATSY